MLRVRFAAEPDPIILASAYRHDVADSAMLHAIEYPVRHFVQDDTMIMFIGPDQTGTLLEIGVIEWHGVLAIVHAMRPREVSEVTTMSPRSIDEITARANEYADAFENYEPNAEDQNSPIPPAMSLKLAAWRRDAAERDLAEAVLVARQKAFSWRKIGSILGTSGEAARQRYSRRTAQTQFQAQAQKRVTSGQ